MVVCKIIPTGAGSAKYGNCEMCHKPTPSIVHLVITDVTETSNVPLLNIFGCHSCCEERMNQVAKSQPDNIPTGMKNS